MEVQAGAADQPGFLVGLAEPPAAGVHLVDAANLIGSPAQTRRLTWAVASSGLVAAGPAPTGPACTRRSPPTPARRW
jgi:hypothetical protein